MQVVLDTNVLVAAAYAPASASRTLVEACLAGRLQLVVSSAVEGEYRFILARALRKTGYEETLARLIDGAKRIEPTQTPRVVPEDPDDDKLVALALAAGAMIVTNDEHLLPLDPYQGVRIVPPRQFVDQFLGGQASGR